MDSRRSSRANASSGTVQVRPRFTAEFTCERENAAARARRCAR
ncbi:MAG: hypothetical protein U1F49_00550 [Rubrivivax sp.]